RLHHDAGPGAVPTRPPGALDAHDLAVAELLGVLAEVPDGAATVLGVEVPGVLDQFAADVRAVPDDADPDAVDQRRPARHVHHLAAAVAAVGAPVDHPGAWWEGQERVV